MASSGRSTVGADIKVFYPGRKGFTPDLIAVADATPDNRDSWMVRKEGKGVDLAIEIPYKGDWRKDFVDNVEKYADLGISEYFAFDLRRQRLVGYRLPRPSGRKYSPLRAVRGRLRSQVLGLELVAEDGGLRFYHGTARLFHLEQMLDQAEARAEQANERAEQANERAEQAVRRLQEAVLNALRVRGLMVSAELAARIRDTSDLEQLDQLLLRALTVASADELILL